MFCPNKNRSFELYLGLVLERWYCSHSCSKAQELCEGRGGRRELAIPNNLHGLVKQH